MANDDKVVSVSVEDTRLASLRNLAQQHLAQIENGKAQEHEEEVKRMAELKREARRRDGTQVLNQISSADPKEKAARMRPAEGMCCSPQSPAGLIVRKDVLNRLRWEPGIDISQYAVGYLDRFGGCLELPAARWIRDSTEEEWVPQHRIRYFKRVIEGREEVVWDRDERIDKVFGSGVAQQ